MDKGAASSAPFFCARMALVETRKGSAMAEEGILHDGIYRVGDSTEPVSYNLAGYSQRQR